MQLGTGDPLKFSNTTSQLNSLIQSRKIGDKKSPMCWNGRCLKGSEWSGEFYLDCDPLLYDSTTLVVPQRGRIATQLNIWMGETNKKTCAVQHIVNVFPLLLVFITVVSKQTRPFISIPRAVQKNVIGSFQSTWKENLILVANVLFVWFSKWFSTCFRMCWCDDTRSDPRVVSGCQ